MEKQRGDSSSGSSPSSSSPPSSSSFWTFLNTMMVEPLGAELQTNNKRKRNDPIGSPRSHSTFTTEEDRQQQHRQHEQQQIEQTQKRPQQRRQNPLSASETIRAISRIPNSGEFQIYEDENDNYEDEYSDNHYSEEDEYDDDSETEWGSCVEYEESTATVPQHELLNGNMMSLETKLGLEPVAQRQRGFVEKDEGKEQEQEQTRGLAKATDEDGNSCDSSERTSSSSATSSSSSSPSSFGKKPVSLRAPMSKSEMKLMSSRLEERYQSHLLETSRQGHEQHQHHSTLKFQSTVMRSNLAASSSSLGTMDGDWTAHSKPPEIEIQLKTNNGKGRATKHDDENGSCSDGSFSSFFNNTSSNNNNGLPTGRKRPSIYPGEANEGGGGGGGGGGTEKRGSSRSSLHQNRLGQMKSRWESMKGTLGESTDISFDNRMDDSSSSASIVESLSSEEDESNEHPTLKRQTRRPRESSHSAPANTNTTNNNNSKRGRSLLRGSAKSAPPGDRRAAMMMESRQPSGNRMKALMAFKEATKSVRSNITSRENFNFRSMVRKTREIDMETGATMTREFTAKRIVDEEFFFPMNPKERRKKLFLKNRLQSKNYNKGGNLKISMTRGNNPMNYRTGAKRDLFSAQAEDDAIHQYRLSSMIAKNDTVLFGNQLNPLREYLYWCLRKSFIFVLLSESAVFLTWCWGFAILYYILGRINPQCIQGAGGYDFEEGNMSLVDSFTLSWTTFSTVGYGHIYPSIHSEGASTGCILITCLTSLQSFVGVLSASFCSAVIFAKVAKYQSIAHVMFSNSVVIRFGQELMQHVPAESDPDLFGNKFKFNIPYTPDNDNSKTGISLKSGKSSKSKGKVLDRRRRSSQETIRYPCPIMEFRVVNLLHKEAGGEIMNCRLNVVASSLEEVTKTDKTTNASFFDNVIPSKQVVKGMKAIQSAAKTTSERSRSIISTSGELMKRGSIIQNVNRAFSNFGAGSSPYALDGSKTDTEAEGQPFKEGETSSRDDDDVVANHQSIQLENLLDDLSSSSGNKQEVRRKSRNGRSQSIFVDEEPCNLEGDRASNSRRVFSKVEIETDSHPFFKRVWNIRHILNEDSPLLTAETRTVIRLNGGLWPASLCNPDAIEGCLEISQLIVSLSGTAVVSGSSVYKLQVYERGFVEIGKTFENPLIRDPDGKLTIDMQLVHTTKPQFEEELSESEDLHKARRFSFQHRNCEMD